MVPLRTYLFGGAAAVALIAGTVAAFLAITAVVSEGTLQGRARAVAAPPADTLNIGAGRGPGPAASPGGRIPTPPWPVAGPYRVVDLHPGGPGHGVGSPGAAGEPTRSGSGDGASQPGLGPAPSGGSGSGGTPSGDPGNGGTPSDDGGRPLSPGVAPGHALATGPHAGLPPGLAKKPGGLPPGRAKKPGGLPPGLAKKHD